MGTDQNNRRHEKLKVFCRFATDLALLSRCKRKQVGTVIIPNDLTEVLAIGYNGPPAGHNNNSCRSSEGSCGCCHSEVNALIKMKSRESDLILITTLAPCEQCAGLIVNNGRIKLLIYRDAYRNPAGLDLLMKLGVQCVQESTL